MIDLEIFDAGVKSISDLGDGLKVSIGQNELCRDEGINSFPTEFILVE